MDQAEKTHEKYGSILNRIKRETVFTSIWNGMEVLQMQRGTSRPTKPTLCIEVRKCKVCFSLNSALMARKVCCIVASTDIKKQANKTKQ